MITLYWSLIWCVRICHFSLVHFSNHALMSCMFIRIYVRFHSVHLFHPVRWLMIGKSSILYVYSILYGYSIDKSSPFHSVVVKVAWKKCNLELNCRLFTKFGPVIPWIQVVLTFQKSSPWICRISFPSFQIKLEKWLEQLGLHSRNLPKLMY